MRTPGGSLATLASYPAFFSLSLTNRCAAGAASCLCILGSAGWLMAGLLPRRLLAVPHQPARAPCGCCWALGAWPLPGALFPAAAGHACWLLPGARSCGAPTCWLQGQGSASRQAVLAPKPATPVLPPLKLACAPPPLFCSVVPRHRFFLHCHAQRTAAAAGAAPAAAAAAAAAAHSSAGLVGLPDVPFPYGHLKCSDAEFVKHCGSTLEDYEAFKARLFEGPVK